jgi:thiol-disulfide isomerase/thioredoxin
MRIYCTILFSALFILKTYSQNTVVFNVKFTGPIHKKVEAVSYDYINNKFVFYECKVVKIDAKQERLSFDIKSPVELTIFNQTIFVEPGQTYQVKYFLGKDSAEVTGKYYGNAIYSEILENRKYPEYQLSAYNGKEIQLKELLHNKCSSKLAIVDSIFRLNIMSAACYKYMYNEIYYSFLSSLLAISKTVSPNDSVTINILLEDFKMSKFIDSSNLLSKFYGFAISEYCINILVKRNLNEYSKDHLNRSIAAIKSNFSGLQKEYLLCYVFRLYARKQLPEYHERLDSLFSEFNTTVKSTEYNTAISNWYEFYNKANKVMPDFVLNAQLYNKNGDSIALHSLLKQGSKNIIDFWASWCSPCVKQINEYNTVKDKISDRYNIIFISIDDEMKNHQVASGKLNLVSYLLSPYNSEKIKDFFAIPPIPHSILVENNQIKDIGFDFYTFLKQL